jgi:hypothetical protein
MGGEGLVDMTDHDAGRAVRDGPQAGDDVPISGKLESCCEVNGLVRQLDPRRRRLAGREEREVGVLCAQSCDLQHGQRAVVEVDGSAGRIVHVLDAVAGKMYPLVPGQMPQDGLPGGLGANDERGVTGRRSSTPGSQPAQVGGDVGQVDLTEVLRMHNDGEFLAEHGLA